MCPVDLSCIWYLSISNLEVISVFGFTIMLLPCFLSKIKQNKQTKPKESESRRQKLIKLQEEINRPMILVDIKSPKPYEK